MVEDNQLYLRAMVALPDGTESLSTDIRGELDQAQELGDKTANCLLDRGGKQLLAKALEQSAARQF